VPVVREAGPSPEVSTQRRQAAGKVVRIGRTPDNDLVLAQDFGVSRNHAELRRSPAGTYEIVDLGSHNGTFVNGSRVSRAALTKYDEIAVGHSVFCIAGS
jgi:ABC transport system ATP-binding/permease protein